MSEPHDQDNNTIDDDEPIAGPSGAAVGPAARTERATAPAQERGAVNPNRPLTLTPVELTDEIAQAVFNMTAFMRDFFKHEINANLMEHTAFNIKSRSQNLNNLELWK
ncbi:hypothetical protein PUN28_003713 [Cardiocondyla obscurior]|uniref:Uncharacterized protein n=1 Tax=Cardiocondyla obscurior TaxID=286306 RepID=A0AAW2GLU2_9HYME